MSEGWVIDGKIIENLVDLNEGMSVTKDKEYKKKSEEWK